MSDAGARDAGPGLRRGDTPRAQASARPGSGVLHPLVLGGLLVVVANDHFLKHAWPGVVSGKLSDFAGMMFFPFWLQASVELAQATVGRYRGASRGVAVVCAALTAGFFAAIKLSPAVADVYCAVWSTLQWLPTATFAWITSDAIPPQWGVQLTMDATDLVALPGTLAVVFVRRRQPAPLEPQAQPAE